MTLRDVTLGGFVGRGAIGLCVSRLLVNRVLLALGESCSSAPLRAKVAGEIVNRRYVVRPVLVCTQGTTLGPDWLTGRGPRRGPQLHRSSVGRRSGKRASGDSRPAVTCP